MSDLSTLISERYQQQKHDIDWLKSLQKKAYEAFQEKGFPTRKTEDWKYTSCDKLLKNTFTTTCSADAESNQHMIRFVDGVLSVSEQLPDGVVVSTIFDALLNHQDLLSSSLNGDAFFLLNLALFEGGVFVHVAKDAVIETPIEIFFHHSDAASAHHLRNIYLVEEGASVSITESFESEVDASYFHHVISELHVQKNAVCNYYKQIDEGKNAFHIAQSLVHLEKDARANCHSFAYGSTLVRSDIHAYLNGQGAHCELNGLTIAGDAEHVDNHTSLNHLSPLASSNEVYKGIIGGKAKVVFNGNIFVEKDAQKTNAALSNKNILLSPHASVDTKPQLEIFADDVKCAHGTTVGQLDPKALFYLTSRGIDLHQAKQMLIHAFAKDVIDEVGNDTLKKNFMASFEEKLGKVA